MIWIKDLANQLKIRESQIENTLSLIKEDKTIPFIARYRKEATGCLDELQIRSIFESYHTWLRFLDRKQEIINALTNNSLITAELSAKIEQCINIKELEELYLPYKKKQKTRADVAMEKGLKPLAESILSAKTKNMNILKNFINPDKGVLSEQDALAGAMDILAEQFSFDPGIRQLLLENIFRHGKIICKKNEKVEDEKQTYKNYYDNSWSVRNIPSWRILAINRAESEKIIKVKINMEWEAFNNYLIRKTNQTELTGLILLLLQLTRVYQHHPWNTELSECMLDSYKRLLFPALEREIRNQLTEKAEDRSLEIFQKNLRHLMLTPPLKKTRILGIDPGYRTGCKVAVIDENGAFLDYDTIFPTPPQNKKEEASKTLTKLYQKHHFQLIAIGNGTASHETEDFISGWLEKHSSDPIKYVIVSEAGASVYSASDSAREEFPDLDVSVRGAVSIGRRVQDMMNELVKIPPESIGVGMYQHDISQNVLKEKLSLEVESVVNHIGVDLNQASGFLLQFVSGFNKKIAKSVLEYRNEHQGFKNRNELKKVKGIGDKVYELSAGFCRVPESANPLDDTIIHPENYPVTEQLIRKMGFTLKDINQKKDELNTRLNTLSVPQFAEELNISIILLNDIKEALLKRRDPREDYPQPVLKDKIKDLNSLYVGYQTQGVVRNVTDFGIFADIGTGKDALIYRSSFPNYNPEDYYPGMILLTEIILIDQKNEKIGLKIV